MGRGFDLGPLGFDDEKKPDPRKPAPSDPGYSPWSDPSGEGWKAGAESAVPEGLLSALRETAERDFDDTFRALVVKFLWDMFWSFIKPTEGAIDSVLKQIATIGVEQVLSQYNPTGSLEPESLEVIKQAGQSSVERFRAIFGRPMLHKEFMAAARDAFRKGLKK